MNWTSLPLSLALVLCALPQAHAGSELTLELGQRLEQAVRHRAQLNSQASVVVDQVRVSNKNLASVAASIKRIELPVGEDGLGRVAAKALLIGSDGSESWTWVQAQVDASVPTLVAARELSRGATLKRDDVELAMLPVHRQNLTEGESSLGQVVRRTIRAGEPVRSSWLTRAYALKRGDLVETIIRRGAVIARGSAKAAERGRVGDVIRVQVLNNRRTLRARVLDNRRVEVVR